MAIDEEGEQRCQAVNSVINYRIESIIIEGLDNMNLSGVSQLSQEEIALSIRCSFIGNNGCRKPTIRSYGPIHSL